MIIDAARIVPADGLVLWGAIKTTGTVMSHQFTLQWCHNERDGISNHQPQDRLLNRLFKAQIKDNIKAPRHWLLWGEFSGDWWIPHTKGQ